MPARIVAIVSYVVLTLIILYGMCTSSLEDSMTEAVLAMGNYGRSDESVVRLFVKEGVTQMRNTRFIPALVILLVDFVFRFMVIESLHNKFKGQLVPTTSYKV